MNIASQIKGCLYAGAMGDCIGGHFENSSQAIFTSLDFPWKISDDTQLTIATCEAIIKEKRVDPATIAQSFLQWYNAGKLTGLGSSTLTALKGLQVGGHWALVGRQGEFAAGNGAAMRISPLAFINADRQMIADVCRITHKNDEAYIGALAIVESIRAAATQIWTNDTPLLPTVINALPDSRTRDRLIKLSKEKQPISAIARQYGNTGHVADSVPLAIYAAGQIGSLPLQEIFIEIIKGGGDTDTTCAMAGNIIGAKVSYEQIPKDFVTKLRTVKEYAQLEQITNQFIALVTSYR